MSDQETLALHYDAEKDQPRRTGPAFCDHCSRQAQDYVRWPCAVVVDTTKGEDVLSDT